MKKLISLLLILTLVLPLFPAGVLSFPVAAATSGTTGDCTWTLEDGVLTISGNGKMGDYSHTYINGNYVTTAPWGTAITKVVVEDGVISIGSYAFENCTNLASVTIPDGVTSIGRLAFSDCTSLASVTIPDGVTSIGAGAFSGCSSLTSIIIPDGVTGIFGSVFQGCTSLTSVIIPGSVTGIWSNAFLGCTSLTTITIPGSVTSIGGGAFSGCKSLTSITIPDSVTSISGDVFQGCTSLTSITIPDSVTSIGSGAFYGCESLTSVTIPDSVTSIGGDAFRYCTSLISVTIGNNVTIIWWMAFENCTSLTSVTIGNSVTSIGAYAFRECTSLTSVSIPDSVTSIGKEAFAGCNSLTSVTIGNGVTTISEYAFEYCDSLTAITIPDSVTSIGDYAFSDCTSLTSVAIPDSVTSIGEGAFSDCTSLTSVAIPDSVTSIGEGAFSDCTSLTSVAIPDSVTSIGNWAFYDCTSLSDVYYGGSESDWKKIGGLIDNYYLKNATIHYNSSAPSTGEDITVPPACSLSALTTVDYLAFSSIAYLDFDNVSKIGSVQGFLGNKWNTTWSGDITHGELCSHIAGWEPFYVSKNTATGYYAVAFRNDANEVVIAYRGSRSLSESWNADTQMDWIENDLPLILGNKKGTQLYDAIETYNDLAPTYGKSNIVTTGHSLGGALGDLVSAYSGCKGITFNAVPALDAVYGGDVEIMAPAFAGVDAWNFVDQANEDDFLAGAWEVTIEGVRIKPYAFYESNGKFAHGLESLVHKNSNGNVVMTAKTTSFQPASVISSRLSSALNTLGVKSYLDLGTSNNDYINKGLSLLQARISYGGDGFDTITTGIHDDTLIGGKSNDDLDGGYGDDTYIYCKGDGKDTIVDVSGKDKLYLYGFAQGDSFDILDDEAAGYIFVRCNGEVIVQIKNNNRNQLLNSFTIYIQQGKDPIEHEITDYFKSKNFGAHVIVACPVYIQILDENGEVVYRIKDGEVGNYYTEYGNFYVYEEEDGSFGKVLDLVEGYTFEIVGLNDGSMDLSYQSVSDGGLSEAQTLTDRAVTDSYTATLDQTSGETLALKEITHTYDHVCDTVCNECGFVRELRFDDYGTTGDCFWYVEGTKLTIFGNGAMGNYDWWDNNAPWGYEITEVVIEDGVTSIGDLSFEMCTELISVSLPNSLKSVGYSAFSYCTKLSSIAIPSGVTFIDYGAFNSCQALESITLPTGLTTIQPWTFFGCQSLTSVIIPNGVTTIEEDAFGDCTALVSVTIPGSVTFIGNNVFYSCSALTSITIPKGVTSIGDKAFLECTSLTSLTVDENNTSYHSAGNCLIETASKTLLFACKDAVIPNDGSIAVISSYCFFGRNDLVSVLIPEGVTTIGECAFYACKNLTEIKFPSSLTAIDEWAFNGCSALTSITIPKSVTSIGSGAFMNCNSLDSISVEKGNEAYHVSGNCLIETESKTLMVAYKNFVIPKDGSVTAIGDYAFTGFDFLTSVTLPADIVSIGLRAFWSLEDVWYEGVDRDAITIDESNYVLMEAAWHYIDGDCDDTCNECGEVRRAPHFYDDASDLVCNECGHERQFHVYDNACDDECNVCGAPKNCDIHIYCYSFDWACDWCSSMLTGGDPHDYDNECDTTCNECGFVREVGDHFYDSTTDTFCNECGYERQLHVYDNACDLACNVCGAFRTCSIHIYCYSFDEACEGCCAVPVGDWHDYDNECDTTCNECGFVREVGDHFYDNATDMVCNECGYTCPTLAFYGANLTLENDLTVNFAVQKSLIDSSGIENPYVVFVLGDRTVKVTEYREEQGYYVFPFKNLAPQMMGDTITATLYATIDGKDSYELEYSGTTVSYTVTKYCGQVFADANAAPKLKTLIADLILYGTAAQQYAGHKTGALVKDQFAEAVAAYATKTVPAAESVSNAKYKEIASPSVQWTGASLNLYESVSIQLQFTAPNITGLTAEVRDSRGRFLATLTEEEITKSGAAYTLFYKGLNAGEMRKPVFITFYDAEGNAVSNTLRYSVESYVAIVHQYGGDAKLVALLDAMLNYGISAEIYAK